MSGAHPNVKTYIETINESVDRWQAEHLARNIAGNS